MRYGYLGGDFNAADIVSGAIGSGDLSPNSVTSGDIASGQVGSVHLRDGTILSIDIASGAIQSGQVGSGSVPGFFGTTRAIQSGTVGVSDFGSGAVIAGAVGSGAIVSGNVASGQLGNFHIASGQVQGLGGTGVPNLASGTVNFDNLSSGSVRSGHIASGQVTQFAYGSGSIQSGAIGSGQVGNFAIASGQVQGLAGAGVPNLASGTVNANNLGSGSVISGHVGSGTIYGHLGTLPHISSGSFTGFELGSGSIVSGRVASGQIGFGHLANASVQSGTVASGQIASGHLASGLISNLGISGYFDDTFTTAELISGGGTAVAVAFTQSGTIQTAMASVSGRMPAVGIVTSNYLSGATATFYWGGRVFASGAFLNFSGWMNQPVYVGRSGQLSASGAPTSSGDIQQIIGVSFQQSGIFMSLGDPLESVIAGSGDVGSGAITGQAGGGYFTIASGTIGTFDIASGAIVSGRVASGSLGRYHFSSGTVIDLYACEMALSGVRAVAWGSGGCYVVAAERTSGLRLPAIGVVAGNFVSGDVVPVVRRGIVGTASSGAIASGFPGRFLYVGSGGLIINQSGYMGGTSSGEGAAPTPAGSGYSGALVQRIGVAVSGGIDVFVDSQLTSGLLSGHLGQY